MCGITGFVAHEGLPQGQAQDLLSRMLGRIAHRGPDASGMWFENGVPLLALGHRRLSILDLSASGNQPMDSPGGRYTIIFNGEIYNFHEMRDVLEARGPCHWHSTSDTEVLLAYIDSFGLEKTLDIACGMFAFALYDAATRQIFLARDRAGEKPLFYGWHGSFFVFGSELRVLKELPLPLPSLNPAAMAPLIDHMYVPAPLTIYRGISKLMPGTFASLSLDASVGTIPKVTPYWQARTFFGTREETHTGTIQGLEDCLRHVMGQTLLSDAPLGAFLSGGIDSSLIVALASQERSSPLRTFTIGFEEEAFDEAPYAKAVAKHLGTQHTELYVTQRDALDLVPSLANVWDEPFGDPSQLPTLLLSKLAREHVTVALSGDGADELFGGYTRYHLTHKAQKILGLVPPFLRPLVAKPSHLLGAKSFSFKALGSLMEVEGEAQIYQNMISGWWPTPVLKNVPPSPLAMHQNTLHDAHLMERMMYADFMMYLPDDIMVKVDRASMAVSLETRAPFLDRRFIEYAATLSPDLKTMKTRTKIALREILYKYVPRTLLERPKQGFGVPLTPWLRGELKEWASALLSPSALSRTDFFDVDAVRAMWEAHQDGTQENPYRLWNILMFQAWYAANVGGGE